MELRPGKSCWQQDENQKIQMFLVSPQYQPSLSDDKFTVNLGLQAKLHLFQRGACELLEREIDQRTYSPLIVPEE